MRSSFQSPFWIFCILILRKLLAHVMNDTFSPKDTTYEIKVKVLVFYLHLPLGYSCQPRRQPGRGRIDFFQRHWAWSGHSHEAGDQHSGHYLHASQLNSQGTKRVVFLNLSIRVTLFSIIMPLSVSQGKVTKNYICASQKHAFSKKLLNLSYQPCSYSTSFFIKMHLSNTVFRTILDLIIIIYEQLSM